MMPYVHHIWRMMPYVHHIWRMMPYAKYDAICIWRSDLFSKLKEIEVSSILDGGKIIIVSASLSATLRVELISNSELKANHFTMA